MSRVRKALDFASRKRISAGAKEFARRDSDKAKRKKLNKIWHLNSVNKKARAGVKRAIGNVVRKDKKYLASGISLSSGEMLLLLRERRSSNLLDHFYPERQKNGGWTKLSEREYSDGISPVKIELEEFSFLDRPRKTLNGLAEIAKAEASVPLAKLDFLDKYCLDVAPYMLLVDCWDDMLPIFEGGKMDLPMQKVLAAIGIENALGVSFQGVGDFNDVWAFPISRRRSSGETQSAHKHIDAQTREGTCDTFCAAMDEWLGRPEFDLELTTKGAGWIKSILGELLENAERHADGVRRDGAWSVSGFLAKRDDQFIVQIGIISLGDTFAKSMERAGDAQKKDIADYIAAMQKANAPQSIETLTTLAALQDGVTCDPEADNAGRGGTGLMEMLSLINILGGTVNSNQKLKVTIISGSACIQLHEPYVNGEVKAGENAARVQWCNLENSAKVVPESAHVYDLDSSLPGTSISIRFNLDAEYLSAATQGKTND